ncbi:MAG: DUF1772 domain-containing protein [Acidobacteria bacterium]|nr:DUF1772 domain-containing protein [Acidobacteriota bacterium]
MRNKLAYPLLIASIFVWGIWCGGQVFNELMTVPRWSASPPESMRAYAALPTRGGLPFFPIFGSSLTVLSIAAALVAWKSARRARIWLALSAGISIVLFIALVFYLAPLVQSMFQHSIAGDLSDTEIIAGVERWKLGNRIRLIIELSGFVFSIIALRVWSAENALPSGRAG